MHRRYSSWGNGERSSSSSGHSCKQSSKFIFFQCWGLHQQSAEFAFQRNCVCTNLTFPTFSRELSLFTREFCTAKVMTVKSLSMRIWKLPCRNPFSKAESKCSVGPMAWCCMFNLGLTFSLTSELLYPNMKLMLGIIRPDIVFTWLRTKPYVSLGVVDCSLYTRRMALKNDFHKKWICLQLLLWSSVIWRL